MTQLPALTTKTGDNFRGSIQPASQTTSETIIVISITHKNNSITIIIIINIIYARITAPPTRPLVSRDAFCRSRVGCKVDHDEWHALAGPNLGG